MERQELPAQDAVAGEARLLLKDKSSLLAVLSTGEAPLVWKGMEGRFPVLAVLSAGEIPLI